MTYGKPQGQSYDKNIYVYTTKLKTGDRVLCLKKGSKKFFVHSHNIPDLAAFLVTAALELAERTD